MLSAQQHDDVYSGGGRGGGGRGGGGGGGGGSGEDNGDFDFGVATGYRVDLLLPPIVTKGCVTGTFTLAGAGGGIDDGIRTAAAAVAEVKYDVREFGDDDVSIEEAARLLWKRLRGDFRK